MAAHVAEEKVLPKSDSFTMRCCRENSRAGSRKNAAQRQRMCAPRVCATGQPMSSRCFGRCEPLRRGESGAALASMRSAHAPINGGAGSLTACTHAHECHRCNGVDSLEMFFAMLRGWNVCACLIDRVASHYTHRRVCTASISQAT